MFDFGAHPLLLACRKELLASAKPVVRLTLTEDVDVGVFVSKVGGVPFRLKGEVWPTSADGADMCFLAQLNFSDLPRLEGFPSSGMLQFFVGTDVAYGGDTDDFKVIWRPETPNATDHNRDLDLSTPAFDEDDIYTPCGFEEVGPLTGELGTQLPHAYSQQFSDIIARGTKDNQDQASEIYWEATAVSDCHQMGGWPSFSQTEESGSESLPDMVLLQLGSDDLISWADGGQGAFFITAEDLAKRDFTHVTYYWDCG